MRHCTAERSSADELRNYGQGDGGEADQAASAKLHGMDEIGVVATVVGVGIAAVALWFQTRSHRRDSDARTAALLRPGPLLKVSVANSLPTFTDGRTGDWYVTVKAYNDGDRPLTIEAWGFELPDGGSIFQAKPVAWSPPLPCRLEPGDKVEFWMPSEGIRQSLAGRKVKIDQTRSWVRLASDEKFYGPPAPLTNE